MQIAAILTVAVEETPRRAILVSRDTLEVSLSFARVEVLGDSLLDRTLTKLADLGTLSPKVLSGRNVSDHVLPSRSARSGSFIDSWEKAVCDYVNNGVETIVLIRVGTYSDVNLDDVIGFHQQAGSPLTQVYSGDTSLDIAVVNATLLRNRDDLVRRALSHLIPQQQEFSYEGYVNRLRNRADLHRLMQDGLHGVCRLSPVGTEVRPGVWYGDGVEVDKTASISGRAFIGAGTRVSPGCVISGTSSIERDCEVDCGTVIESALVLRGTYVGMALDVKNSVVGNEKILNLERNVEVRISDARLIGRRTKPSVAAFSGLTSWFRHSAQAGD